MAIKPVSGEIKSQILNDNFSALDSNLANLSIGPFDTYTNLSALQSTYPNGRNGFAVVLESDGKTGYMYTWTGSIWKKGGLAQSMGIADKSVARQKMNYFKALFTDKITEKEKGVYYPVETGDRTYDATKGTTSIINVVPGQKLKIRKTGLGASGNQSEVYFWRASGNKNGGIIADGEFTVSENSTQLRMSFGVSSFDDVVLFPHDEEYGFADESQIIVDNGQLLDNILTPEKTTYINKQANNIFDFKSFIADYHYNLTGAISTSNGLGSFEFPVKSGENYEMAWVGFGETEKGNTYITFWSDSAFVSSVQAQKFTVPDNSAIKYCRIAVKPNASHEPEIYLTEKKEKYVDESTKINASQIEDLPQKFVNVSICGDSISTFTGAMVSGNRTYYPNNTVDDWLKTYWGKLVANKYWLRLLVNNSWSGSWVSTGQGNGTPSSSGTVACKYLSKNGIDPDVIILYKGTNDFGGNVSLTDFTTQYQLMITNTKQRYPDAKIYVCTILYRTDLTNTNDDSVVDFNDVITTLANDNILTVIDFYNCGIDATNSSQFLIDGLHPSAKGHELMYQTAKKVVYEYI